MELRLTWPSAALLLICIIRKPICKAPPKSKGARWRGRLKLAWTPLLSAAEPQPNRGKAPKTHAKPQRPQRGTEMHAKNFFERAKGKNKKSDFALAQEILRKLHDCRL